MSILATPAVALTEVVLHGGPIDLPAELRTQVLAADAEKIKIPHYGGYEHFERTPATDAAGALVFHWTGRTRIAE